MVKFTAAITKIRSSREDTGYTVFSAKVTSDNVDEKLMDSRGQVTVVGKLRNPNVSQHVSVEGEFENHPTYGNRIVAREIIPTKFQHKSYQREFLGSGILRNLDTSDAEKLYEVYQESALDAIINKPEDIAKRTTIRLDKLKDLQQEVISHNKNGLLEKYSVLRNLGTSEQASASALNLFGSNTIGVANSFPYRLLAAPGIGFKTADNIAKKLGVHEQSELRITTGLYSTLERNSNFGHTYIEKTQLVNQTAKLLGLHPRIIAGALEERIESKHLVSRTKQGSNVETISSYQVAKNEADLARNIEALMSSGTKRGNQKSIANSGRFNPLQLKAVETSINENLTILTGGPGTGKTYTISGIIEQFQSSRYQEDRSGVLILAPTGKAARKAATATNFDAKTVHMALEYKNGTFKRIQANPLSAGLIVIDEAGMLDLEIANSVFNAIKHGAKVVIVGDVDQLASVGPGNVLSDLINSNSIPVTHLENSERVTNKQSNILAGAAKIKQGLMPEFGFDFHFIPKKGDDVIRHTINRLVGNEIHDRLGIPNESIQVLSPQLESGVGVNILNKELHDLLNPSHQSKKKVFLFGQEYRLGDRIMQTKNDYKNQFFNGETGKIQHFDFKNENAWVNVDGQIKVLEMKDFADTRLAYSTTIHKSQGSEYDAVVIPLSNSTAHSLSRSSLYTAVTRGKKQVVMVGEVEALEAALANNKEYQRKSMLSDLIHGKLGDYDVKPDYKKLPSIAM